MWHPDVLVLRASQSDEGKINQSKCFLSLWEANMFLWAVFKYHAPDIWLFDSFSSGSFHKWYPMSQNGVPDKDNVISLLRCLAL